ncbi:MAG: PAS domain S-box protein [Candidatus Helarchaeota archaeon]
MKDDNKDIGKINVMVGTKSIHKRYLDIIEKSPVGLLEIDVYNNSILYTNSRVLEILGYDMTELKKSNILKKIIYYEDFQNIFNKEKDNMKLDFRIINKEGKIKWLSGRISRIYKNNKIIKIRLWVDDITHRKKNEFNIIKQNLQLELLNNIIISGNKALNVNEFINNVLKLTVKFMKMDVGAFYLYDKKRNYSILIEQLNFPKYDIKKIKSINMKKEPYCHLYNEKIPLIISNTSKIDPILYKINIISCVVIPLLSKDEYIGSLNLGCCKFREFSRDEIFFLLVIGQHVGSIIKKFQSEEKLRHSEEMFRTLSEQSLIAIIIIQNGFVKFVNKRASEIIEYPLKDIMNWNDIDFLKIIHEQDKDFVLNKIKRSRRIDKSDVHYSTRIITKSGRVKWIDIYSQPIFFNGKFARFINFIDITNLKETEKKLLRSEEKYRLISENANDLIAIINNLGKYEYINESIYQKLTGYSKKEIIGKNVRNFLHPEDIKIFKKAVKEYLNTWNWGAKIRFRKKNGSYIWLDSKGKMFLDNEKQKSIIIARDVSDAIKAEEEIKRQNIELKELDRVKDEFFADISHEFRTPLTAIKGFTEILLKSKNLTSIEKSDLKVILRNEERLELLVNELLNYTRLKAGNIKLINDKFRVSEIVYDIKNELEPLIQRKQLNIIISFIPDDELILDKFQISKVIKNIFTNAIKFSSNGGNVYITSEINDKSWTFSIHDEGIGIKKEDIPKLFTRFIKLDSSKDLNPNGIGIGLAMCKKIIELYDGRIWVESDGLNKGSKFCFEIKFKNKKN